MPLAGGLPSGLSSRDETRTGTSCGWQFNTQAACSTVIARSSIRMKQKVKALT
jgi:hypothetical protein